MPIIRSISGIRFTLESLNEEFVVRHISAFSQLYPQCNLVIGRDGRSSGIDILKIILNHSDKLQNNIIDLGIVPTPTVQLYVEKNGNSIGLAITASHNPAEWNGLKFINPKGTFLDEQENTLLFQLADNLNIINLTSSKKKVTEYNAKDFHIEQILKLNILNAKIDNSHTILEQIKHKNFAISVDAINSSGSVIVPKLLEIFNCKVYTLNCLENGEFVHNPEPLPENLSDLCNLVKRTNSDLGIAVDPDADRLVLIDNNGNPVWEELTITLATLSAIKIFNHIKTNKEKNVVINYSTTQTVEELCAEYGFKVFRTPVGEINVIKGLQKHNGFIGGEGSGGVIFPDFHYGRDSLIGITLILCLLAISNKKISEIIDELPKNYMIKKKYYFHEDIEILIEKISKIHPTANIIKEDGLKIIYPSKWLQIRKSNTEPIIRIIAEAKSENECNSLINSVINQLPSYFHTE